MSHLTHPHATGRGRARRRYSTLSRRDEAMQWLALAFFVLVITAFTLAAAGPLLA